MRLRVLLRTSIAVSLAIGAPTAVGQESCDPLPAFNLSDDVILAW